MAKIHTIQILAESWAQFQIAVRSRQSALRTEMTAAYESAGILDKPRLALSYQNNHAIIACETRPWCKYRFAMLNPKPRAAAQIIQSNAVSQHDKTFAHYYIPPALLVAAIAATEAITMSGDLLGNIPRPQLIRRLSHYQRNELGWPTA